MSVKTLVFDLDGTLIDSAADLQAALNRIMSVRGLAPFDRPAVIGMIGDGVDALVRRGFAARGQQAGEPEIAAFRAEYGPNAAIATRAYPGTENVLRALAANGWRLGVCTNKPYAPAMAILDALNLTPLLHAVTGGDGPRKPDPAHILAAVRAAGGTPDHAIAIGDHANDMLAAKAAGMRAIFAGWGYGTPAMAQGFPIAAAITGVPGMIP